MTLPLNPRIVDASISQLDELFQIETQCFEKEAFTKNQILQLLSEYNSIGLVAQIDSEIVGFIVGRVYVDRNALYGHILTLDVAPLHRQKGIGRALLEAIEDIFKRKGVKASSLEVREDNVAAISLYTRLGYEKIGRLKNYYHKVTGLYLRKSLT